MKSLTKVLNLRIKNLKSCSSIDFVTAFIEQYHKMYLYGLVLARILGRVLGVYSWGVCILYFYSTDGNKSGTAQLSLDRAVRERTGYRRGAVASF